ncbi:hypothetical protein [Rhodoferax sp.]|uniref:hypothetical protein n=1 Tax=Rhodoferax sp. TaxID=50421 RepID=UPI00272FD432|nr:hypothetical protein [Rhodoferax sp.]MDP1531613.1 hypothetical protein [Rhodoferax sp.]MDP1944170.1 hypothetical protein [Rhodoferax sp.]MDP2441176.1 hypothetical protein [Rhodoferax sp.]MDZ4209503.1 hypothetical protein [Rhodoferax sp.]
MQWEFTPEDVVKARSEYGLQDFRRDLGEELRANLGPMDEAQQTRSFNLVYDMCYALATDKKFDDFVSAYAFDPPTCEFLTELKPHMADNVVMLGAILQRLIMDRVEANMPLAQAIEDVAQWHAALVSGK